MRYSLTRAGYRAWLDDGNKGSFEKFLTQQKRREKLITDIYESLQLLNPEELQEVLKYIEKTYFSGKTH